MTTNDWQSTSLAAATVTALAIPASAADNASVDTLIANIKSKDDKVRGPAWQGAGPAGAPAVKPLAAVMTDPDFEVARSARRALWKIVRHAGRPGAAGEAEAVTGELVPLLATAGSPVRREVLWMLSEIAGEEAIGPMAALLTDKEVRDDARCSLQRLPGRRATAALKEGFSSAPEDFKAALAHSLRVRGETVAGYPSQKLTPTKQTSVKRLPEI